MVPLHPIDSTIQSPERFTYPFCYEPHPLCQLAAREVQREIACIHPQEGKMFGVLVVERNEERFFLAAYSGLLEGRNDWPYFVPPVYDAQQPDGYFKTREREISELSKIASATSNTSSTRDTSASSATKELSQDLQQWLFHQYQLLNARGEMKDLVDIWQEYYARPKLRQKYPLPPGGTGDCCAPKLLQYAYKHGLKPVCMAEFWWGPSTKEEVRQHLNYYPACRGKCLPILTWMLQGMDVDPNPALSGLSKQKIPVIYEDEHMMVVDKPSGMLSVAGRIDDYSVETVMQQRYAEAKVVHRLDMATSGLLIVAKTPEAYRTLQEQFVKHQVKKKYLAVLENPDNQEGFVKPGDSGKGTISLPLRPDPMNRPRQVVDMEHGKRAVTYYEFMSLNIVALWPQTGRTHQLRIHCAHLEGLGRPIVGDELYGTKADRLYLHASEIWFTHPVTGEQMHLISPAPFL